MGQVNNPPPTASSAAPVAANSAGVPGQIAYDGAFIYVCVALNTWLRAAIVTW